MYFVDQNLLESSDPIGLKVFEMQKWNISKYRSQRVYDKNSVIGLAMLTSKVMVIRMSKMAYLMYFLLNTRKSTSSLGKLFKCIWKVVFGPFVKYYGLWSSDLPLANCQHLKIQDFISLLFTQHLFFYFSFFWYFYPQYLTKLRPKPIKHTSFCKNSMRSPTNT